ncbi:MAG: substrate-binding domain-containing protein [Phycisphaerales bacterium]|nr:substrate-binding domain-containing protein [Phycisphaerales bacterium]
MRSTVLFLVGLILTAGWIVGCKQKQSPKPVVTLYTSIPEPVSSVMVNLFTRQTGIEVHVVRKPDSTADVYWEQGVFEMIGRADAGALAKYSSPSADGVLTRYRDSQGFWAGAGLRARTIAYRADERWTRPPQGAWDLTNLEFKGRLVMAKPTIGLGGGYIAALFQLWGDQKTREFFAALHRNDIRLVGNDAAVADDVGRGAFVAGFTNSNDCAVILADGGKLESLLPDQKEMGTLVVPITVALGIGADQQLPARQLVDYLLSQEIEQKLIQMHYAGWSARQESADLKAMEVDYHQLASQIPKAIAESTAILEGR